MASFVLPDKLVRMVIASWVKVVLAEMVVAAARAAVIRQARLPAPRERAVMVAKAIVEFGDCRRVAVVALVKWARPKPSTA